jgi:hypothetical protein
MRLRSTIASLRRSMTLFFVLPGTGISVEGISLDILAPTKCLADPNPQPDLYMEGYE